MHRKRQQYDRAAQVYRGYLAQRKDGKQRGQAEAHLLELSNDSSISQRDEVQDTPALSASVGLGSPSRLRALRFRFAG